uniref:ATP synthase complex subunit 8 n=1 Tax=Ptychoptera qinggouensis TaxID=2785440 RepID=A0A873HLU4_9DIPT|nr:ATP synthase F0 subunit 8 [Ptychoptera qinggouensis]QOZ38529.1 ATP synthase F0 subunit 8 [Ptychoptera qinggouensis]
MPQMAPISWLILFILFTVIFLIFNSMNYFSYLPNTPSMKTESKIQSNAMNWKW